MPITATLITEGTSGGNTPYSSAAILPKPNKVYIASVTVGDSIADNCTIAGCNLTWTKINSASQAGTRVTCWWGIGGAPTTAAVVFTCPSGVNACWSVVELDNVDLVAPIVQSAVAAAESTGVTATLGAFSSTNNATFGAGGGNSSSSYSISAGGGFTTLSGIWSGEQSMMVTEFNAANDTTVDISRSGTGNLEIVGFELKYNPFKPNFFQLF